jgi:hypothetical protein
VTIAGLAGVCSLGGWQGRRGYRSLDAALADAEAGVARILTTGLGSAPEGRTALVGLELACLRKWGDFLQADSVLAEQ